MKNQYRIIMVSILMLFLFNILANAEEVPIKPEKDQNIYFVSVRSTIAEILKVEDKNQLDLVRKIEGYGYIVDSFNEEQFILIPWYEDEYMGNNHILHIVPYNSPWDIRKYENYKNWTRFALEKDGDIYLADYFEERKLLDIKYFRKLILTNITNGEQQAYEFEKGIPENIIKKIEGVNLDLTEGKLTLLDSDNIYPYHPPKEMIEDMDSMKILFSRDKHIGLELIKKSDKETRSLLIYNKEDHRWKEEKIEGEIINFQKNYPIVVYHLKEKRNDQVYQNLVIFNIDEESKQEIILEEKTHLLYIEQDYIILRDEQKIFRIPFIDGRFSLEKCNIIYEENEDNIKIGRAVTSIERAFPGPEEIPAEVLHRLRAPEKLEFQYEVEDIVLPYYLYENLIEKIIVPDDYKVDVSIFKELIIKNKDIIRINGLKYFKNLEVLNLGWNNIEDIRELSDLINLREIYLKNNKIKDISSLSELTNIEIIDLSDNQVKDISPLFNLTALKELNIN